MNQRVNSPAKCNKDGRDVTEYIHSQLEPFGSKWRSRERARVRSQFAQARKVVVVMGSVVKMVVRMMTVEVVVTLFMVVVVWVVMVLVILMVVMLVVVL